MKIKRGASLQGLQLVMRRALVEANDVYAEYGKELVVTSGTDGEHSAGSLHYYGYAIDIRNRFFDVLERKEVEEKLRGRLSTLGFDIVQHEQHIHIEYDEVLGDTL